MGVSLILLRRARPGIALRMFGWVCVYAPTWPGTSFRRYPSLDLSLEKWVDGWVVVGAGKGRGDENLPPSTRETVQDATVKLVKGEFIVPPVKDAKFSVRVRSHPPMPAAKLAKSNLIVT